MRFLTPAASALVVAAMLAPAAARAQNIGTWSSQRSSLSFGTADAFDDLRARLRQQLPNARIVPLHTLSEPVLAPIDVLLLDGQGSEPLSAAEQASLLAFVERGGVLLAQGIGPMGASLGAPFGVKPIEAWDGEAVAVDQLPAGLGDGPFGDAVRFSNRYEGHLAAPPGATTVGDAHGAHLVSIEPGRGRAVFFGNLFAFADREFAPGGLFADANADNAKLLLNLVVEAMPAPKVAVWSSKRSTVALATSPGFERMRESLRATMPGLSFVELEQLRKDELDRIDVLFLDSTATLGADERAALEGFVGAGGTVVAQVFAETGKVIADLYGLSIVGDAAADVKTHVIAPDAAAGLAGPFGPVSTWQNRYEFQLGGANPAAGVVPVVGDAGGARVAWVRPKGARGSALLFTNLFAFADADWSAGGLAESRNDNLSLLGNFIVTALRQRPAATATQPVAAAQVVEALPQGAPGYGPAARRAVEGNPEDLRKWITEHATHPVLGSLAERAKGWIDSSDWVVDPRFFPVNAVQLGQTRRRDLLKAEYKPNDVSKWTFQIGPLMWTCLQGPQDVCEVVSTTGDMPPEWAALGFSGDLDVETFARLFASHGYEVEIGTATISPFGRRVAARGFGVLWQADFEQPVDGEDLITLEARFAP